jgi:hypothetical protein
MPACERVVLYLQSTAHFRLYINGNDIGIKFGISNRLIGYSASNWANNSADLKSQGVLVFIAINGGAILLLTRKQDFNTWGALEAQFITYPVGCREP